MSTVVVTTAAANGIVCRTLSVPIRSTAGHGLIVPKRNQRIDLRGPVGGNVAGEHGQPNDR